MQMLSSRKIANLRIVIVAIITTNQFSDQFMMNISGN